MKHLLLALLAITMIALNADNPDLRKASKQDKEQMSNASIRRNRNRSQDFPSEEHGLKTERKKSNRGDETHRGLVLTGIVVGLIANLVTIGSIFNNNDDDTYYDPPRQQYEKIELYPVSDSAYLHFVPT